MSNTLCSYYYIIVTRTRKLFSTVFGVLKLNKCLVIKTNEYSNVRSFIKRFVRYISNIRFCPRNKHALLKLSYLVSEAPSQLVASSIMPTSFCITISPPTDVTQNGPIVSYTVSYQGELFNTTQVNVSVSVGVVTYPLTASSSVCINGLEEFTNYTVAVRAVNGAGEGAAVTQVVRTLAAGWFYYNIYNKIIGIGINP